MSAQTDSLRLVADKAIANAAVLKTQRDAAIAAVATKQAALTQALSDLAAALANASNPADVAAIAAVIQSLSDSNTVNDPAN